MGTKRVLPAYQIIGGTTGVSGTMTGTSVITSVPTNVQNLDNLGLQVSWTGTPTGTLEVRSSISNVTYEALTFSPALVQPVGSAGGYLIDLNQLPFPWLEVQYTNASGTGSLSVWICGKDVN